jgi:hypothetical protein
MIKFFRTIRQNLLNEGKTSKYLKYAIGEIVLVVIGILIALAINNWNEDRKSDVVELKLLEELKSSIAIDLPINARNIERNMASINSARLLLKYFDNSLPYNDSLDSHFTNALKRYIALVRPNSYQKIKNHGLDFISNDSTKVELSWTFETTLKWLDMLNERATLYDHNYMLPKIGKLFESISIPAPSSEDDKMKPLNYENLKHDEEFKGILKVIINYRQEYVFFHKLIYSRMENLIKMIDHEIQLKKR